MTAQAGDRFTYNNLEYSVVALSGPVQFDPKDYGITPEAICTACWNGYWCDYNISDKGLILQNLYINSKDGYYPEINGVGVEKENGKKRHNMGHHLYKDIGLPIAYSGKIVAGRDFMNQYYIHMGYQRAWAYKILLEFVFEAGALAETIDHSAAAASLREELQTAGDDISSPRSEDEIRKFVEDSFSLELGVKAWWV